MIRAEASMIQAFLVSKTEKQELRKILATEVAEAFAVEVGGAVETVLLRGEVIVDNTPPSIEYETDEDLVAAGLTRFFDTFRLALERRKGG